MSLKLVLFFTVCHSAIKCDFLCNALRILSKTRCLNPEHSPVSESSKPFCSKISPFMQISHFVLPVLSVKRRLPSGVCCFNSAFCADYCLKGGNANRRKTVNASLFDPLSQKKNEISLVTAGHVHKMAGYTQI